MIVGGPPKSYKSFLVSTMAVQLACGSPLLAATRRDNHSRDVPAFPVRKQCRVLILEQEVGFMDMQTRMGTMMLGLCDADVRLSGENIIIHSCDHEMRLDNQAGRDYIAKLIEQSKPDVVIFDPLKEFHYLNENDASDISKVFHSVDWLRERFKFASVISHHSRKESSDKQNEGPDTLRGSSYVFGKADSLMMVKPKKRNHGLVTAEFTIRRGKPIPGLTLLLDRDSLRMNFQKWNIGNDRSNDGEIELGLPVQ